MDSLSKEQKHPAQLIEEVRLLDLIIEDSRCQPKLYQPGPYWEKKTRNIINEIKRCGLNDFRGATNLIGLSFADNLLIDIRDSLNVSLKGRCLRWLTRQYPFNIVFDGQLHWAKLYANETLSLIEQLLNLKQRPKELLKKYHMPYSLLGNPLTTAIIEGQKVSTHYLNQLDQHDQLAAFIDFSKVHTILEIGGGFGSNIHLLLENYPNIRKVLYLDISPILYVSTQYLKSFYPQAVHDYSALKGKESIVFSSDNSLEIFCITPWQFKLFQGSIDIFLNCASFVEMPLEVVRNYVDVFCKFPSAEHAALAFVSYADFDPQTTFDPKVLATLFNNRSFESFDRETLLNSSKRDLFFLSSGKLARS